MCSWGGVYPDTYMCPGYIYLYVSYPGKATSPAPSFIQLPVKLYVGLRLEVFIHSV